jgi:hypothetical protein
VKFDNEGHVVVTPAEVEAALNADRARLVWDVLIPGTPAVFDTFDKYCQFRELVARELSVHPSSIVVRGSAKVGFSMSPKPDKVWMEIGPDSDIDLAIVDSDHYHFLDAEVRQWERDPAVREHRFHGKFRYQFSNLQQYRSFYCLRYLDLPDTALSSRYRDAMAMASSCQPGGFEREVTAFFFRDWWALQSRYEFDLRQLSRGLHEGLPHADQQPRARFT